MTKNGQIYQRIENILHELSNSERKIGQYILNHMEEVIKLTASELATASATSPASVIRFCKSIGIASFTDLKLQLSAEKETSPCLTYSDISANESLSEIKNKLLGNAYQAMEETVALLDEDTLTKAADMIEKANLVYIYGVGASNLVAENFVQKWTRIGKTCVTFSDLHIFMSSMSSAPENTVFIGISNSGETDEVLVLTRLAKERNIATIGITKLGTNSLAKQVDLRIQTVHSKEARIRSAATSSLMAQFLTIDVLFYAYILDHYEENMDRIQQSRQALEQFKAGK